MLPGLATTSANVSAILFGEAREDNNIMIDVIDISVSYQLHTPVVRGRARGTLILFNYTRL
jgi:hypothetical protein